ncbi:MAG: hypothetical protein OXC40_00500 [Proteobacteria bacterium]|nr:hypothetical protein [Pseudomonadota bacterium]
MKLLLMSTLSVGLALTMSLVGFAQESSAENKEKSEEQRKKEIAEKIDLAMKGEAQSDLDFGLFSTVTVAAEQSYVSPALFSYLRHEIAKARKADTLTYLNQQKFTKFLKDSKGKDSKPHSTTVKSEYNLYKELYKELYTNPVPVNMLMEAGFTLNAKILNTFSPSTSLTLVSPEGGNTNAWFDGWKKWNQKDLPGVGFSFSPHYFTPLSSSVLHNFLDKQFGIKTKANFGYLNYGLSYSAGYFYDPENPGQLASTVGMGLSHNNFDPLGPLMFPWQGGQVRGTVSSSFSVAMQTKNWDKPGEVLFSFSTSPSIRFAQFFDNKSQLVAVGFYAPVSSSRRPAKKVFTSYAVSHLRNNTAAYQYVQFAYQKFFTGTANFTFLARLFRDGPLTLPGKPVFDPVQATKWQLVVNLTLDT